MPISELVDFLSGSLTVNEITYPISPSPSTILLADATSGSGLGSDEVRHVFLQTLMCTHILVQGIVQGTVQGTMHRASCCCYLS